MDECSIESCVNPRKYKATGWCQTHYHRYWRTGSIELVSTPLRTDLTYFGAHGRVKYTFGSATKYLCVACGEAADEWAYDGTDPSESTGYVNGKYKVVYSVWPEFYMPMCFSCHRSKDRGAWAERRTHCANGHEMTDDDLYDLAYGPRRG